MFGEPGEQFLYSAYKIHTEYSDGYKTIKGIATGFILEIAKGIPWLVTNRHAVDLDYKKRNSEYKDFKLSNLTITGRKADDTEYTLELNMDAAFFHFHDVYENDIVLVSGHFKIKHGDSIHWHFGMEHLATKAVYETIHAFDLVCYSGFPNTHDKFANRPIIRSGHIASDPRYNYSWDNDYKGECVAYEGFSSEGASGSPVFAPPRGITRIPNSRHGYLIGVNAGHIPDQDSMVKAHSGISYFYKSTVIMEIIDKFDLLNKTFG